ncbi:protein decapentaplegic [Episyrphus balteatus]|uniref:protein decapentaplegic n=1 Tax=Episyrphus balteatus TaxID=286459 RepID=UPI00248586F0|nr:protein decapentaplegic [Episyrphus balteatus]
MRRNSEKMIPNQLFKIKNLIGLSEIKNFKAKKIKKRIKHHQFLVSSSLLCFNYKHHRKYQTQFKCNFVRISEIIESSFSIVSTSVSGCIQLVQETMSAFQLSNIASNNCFKMSLIILFLSILITNHYANCQAIYNNRNENRDSTYIFFSYFNTNDNLRVNSLNNNKSLIEYSESTIVNSNSSNNKNKNNDDGTKNIKNINNAYTLWRSKNNNQQPEPEISYRKYKKYQNVSHSKITSSDLDNEQLIEIVKHGLGLKTLPDFNKANISQLEYSSKYNEYLDRIRKQAISNSDIIIDDFEINTNSSLSLLSICHNSSDTKIYRERRSPMTGKNKNRNAPTKSILLRFPLELSGDIKASDIEEANIRLLLITSPALAASGQYKRRHSNNRQNRVGTNKKSFTYFNHTQKSSIIINKEKHKSSKNHSNNQSSHFINMKVYQLLEPKGKIWIDGQKIEIKFDRNKIDESISQWLQFDVTKAVEEWVVHKKQNLGLEIQCDNCLRNGARIIDDLSGDSEEEEDSSLPNKYDLAPVLNIIGRLGTHREKRSKHYHNQMTEKPKKSNLKNNCYKDNQRCCRHSMEVVFKEIKGFEFIIQPKVFDAGYCRGRCPPRYNPAHHHALLQSLIWKQDRKKVPRPCCAPSKLVELEVLHVDEKDNEKLKISTWTDMRVLECACS